MAAVFDKDKADKGEKITYSKDITLFLFILTIFVVL